MDFNYDEIEKYILTIINILINFLVNNDLTICNKIFLPLDIYLICIFLFFIGILMSLIIYLINYRGRKKNNKKKNNNDHLNRIQIHQQNILAAAAIAAAAVASPSLSRRFPTLSENNNTDNLIKIQQQNILAAAGIAAAAIASPSPNRKFPKLSEKEQRIRAQIWGIEMFGIKILDCLE